MVFCTRHAVEMWLDTVIVSLERMVGSDICFSDIQHTLKCYAPTIPSFVQWSVDKQHQYTDTRLFLNLADNATVRKEITEGWE